MANNTSLEIRALVTLLREALQRADQKNAYFLNPGDPGLIETLRPLSALVASKPPAPGRKPIVAHANHVLYGIELANRSFQGETGVYENSDWSVAWKLESVTESEWKDLVNRLEQQSKLLLEQVIQPREWNELVLTGSFSIAAHTAYHLGAIRQILLDVTKA